MFCKLCNSNAKYVCKDCKTKFCAQHFDEQIGLFVDLPSCTKEYYYNMDLMWMHGTRTTVFPYINHMKDIGLDIALYSTGVLYSFYIYPMSGALGGDLTSKRENVGKKVLSGVSSLLEDNLDRNVYYTKYGQTPITINSLDDDLVFTVNNILKYGTNQLHVLFGQISRIRYWDNQHYKKKWMFVIESTIVPLILNKIEQLQNPEDKILVENTLEKVIYADAPVIQFTNNEKKELQTTHPMILCSPMTNHKIIPHDTENIAEPNEVYIRHLLMTKVAVIFTTTGGCDYVKQRMRDFGNYHVNVICRNELFVNSDKLRGFVRSGNQSEKSKMFNEWKRVLPFWNESCLNNFKYLLDSGFSPTDFEGASVKEVLEIIPDISVEQAKEMLSLI